MKSFKKYVEEQFNPEWDYVVEMATIGHPDLYGGSSILIFENSIK